MNAIGTPESGTLITMTHQTTSPGIAAQ